MTTPKHQILDQLAARGIAKVVLSYDGSGDSGCIEHVAAYDANGAEVSFAGNGLNETLLNEALQDWAYDLLDDHFQFWGNDDGAFGTITLDVPERRGLLRHSERVIETIDHDVEV